MTRKSDRYIIETMLMQIIAGVSLNVYLCWGTEKIYGTIYNNNDCLILKVDGMKYKGFVFIQFVEGLDLYSISLVDDNKQDGNDKVKEIYSQVYNEDLGGVIDELIESGGVE